MDFEVIHSNETHHMHAYFIPIQKKKKHFYITMERKSVLIKSKAIHLSVTYLTTGMYDVILRKPFSELLQRHFIMDKMKTFNNIASY